MNLDHFINRVKLRYRRDGLTSIPTSGFRLGCRQLGLFPALVRARLRLDSVRYNCSATPDPLERYYVDPTEIKYYLLQPPQYRDVYRWFGRIKPGKWDVNASTIEESKKYQGVVQRYIDGREWRDTVVVDYMLKLVLEGKYPDSCTSPRDIEERYKEIDELYENIRSDGYKPDNELSLSRGEIGDVALAIGRNGELILHGDGIHRVAIARVLDLDTIPARISMRHLQWQRLREEIVNKERDPGSLSDHVDLQDLPTV